MLCHRILQRRLCSSAPRFLPPFLSRPSSSFPPAPYRLFFSGCSSPVSALPSKPNAYLDFNFLHRKSYCSSAQPAVDLPAGHIVDVPLAQTGEGIAECELLKWYVQEGDYIEDFQPLCEVQSDKATIEITSRYKGRISNILFGPGDIVKVGETLLKISVDDPRFPSVTTDSSENAKSHDPNQILADESVNATVTSGDLDNTRSLDSDPDKGKRAAVLSTPAVRGLAKQYGIDINEVHGTGKDGRVLKEDVLNFAAQKGIVENAYAVSSADYGKHPQGAQGYNRDVGNEYESSSGDRTIPLRGYQRAMVKSMSLAAKVPHFHYVDEINCNSLVKLKTSFQKNNSYPDVKHTFLPTLIKSLSMALIKYPFVNSCFKEDSLEVLLKGSHNIGVAMATPYGLVVPNIKNVQSLSILEVTKELARLQHLASDNKLTSEDISGGTITLSNIGAIGGKFGSPLLNLPEVAIIAFGRIQKVPQFADDGNVSPASLMTVNIGADHRVLDGATVAKFCNEWKQLIENPELLMLYLR